MHNDNQKITCFIQYKINPFKIKEFEQYAKNWGEIIPRCGGDLLGYFLPHESTNDNAYGLISFNSLADYENYRARLKNDDKGFANFSMAQAQQFIIEENRSFLKIIPQTYKQAAGVVK